MTRRPLGFAGAAVLAVVLIGPASAAAPRQVQAWVSQSVVADAQFPDDPDDATGQAIELTRVDVADNACGTISFAIHAPGQQFLYPKDRIQVLLDTDMNTGTGDPAFPGKDYYIDVDGDGAGGSASIGLYRWTGLAWTLESGSSVTGAYLFGEFITIPRADLDNTPQFRFYVHALYPDPNATGSDLTPEGTYTLDNTGACSSDTRRPTVRALEARPRFARHRLSYRVVDNSGAASWTLVLRRTGTKSKAITWSKRYNNKATNSRSGEYHVDLTLPANIRGPHQFCVQARDAAHNVSRRDCIPVIFRRIKTDAEVLRAQSTAGMRVIRMWLAGLPRRTHVTIDCIRACGVHEAWTGRRTFTSRKFSGKFLRAGVVLVARATKPRWTGYYEKLSVTRSGLRQCTRSLPPRMRNPTKRCP